MEVVTSKFSLSECKDIMRKKAYVGDLRNLQIYNDANHFQIKKLYDNHELVGYAAIFLGYNGIESNDVSLEEIAYWGNNITILADFLTAIKNANDYIIPVENFYFNEKNFPEYLLGALNKLDFKSGRTR